MLECYLRMVAPCRNLAGTPLQVLLLEFCHCVVDVLLQGGNLAEDDLGGFIFDLDTFHFLVLVDAQVIVVVSDFLDGDKEGLFLACPCCLGFQVLETGYHIGDVILGALGALLVKCVAIGFHIVEPHLVGAARIGLGENKDSGGNS